MNLKKLATSGAAFVALTAPAFLASQAHADTNPALNSTEWTGLHTANDGGSNVAYVDKEGLSQTHAAKDAPDFNRGRNWRTAWGK